MSIKLMSMQETIQFCEFVLFNKQSVMISTFVYVFNLRTTMYKFVPL